jgi:hypothetical protein
MEIKIINKMTEEALNVSILIFVFTHEYFVLRIQGTTEETWK